MALITKRVKGTQDILPSNVYKWQFLEDILRQESEACGFKEIRTPVFEHTPLFSRGVGETTDVVQKEMYTFDTKGGTSITLRPEGTAGAARALLENGLYNDALPIKASYFVSCYRYEKPQAGRYREFHQFGLEVYGTACERADAELICAADSIFKRLGLTQLRLEINSIGCPKCRAEYHKALKEYFEKYSDQLCSTCLSRLEKNPMRILDCKSPVCKKIAEDAPLITNYLCSECRDHYNGVKEYLDGANVEYTENPHIVRGLDYYTKTVFEFVTDCIGAQGTVCGGGRYDGLIEELGGPSMPSLGFALGMERLLGLMEKQGIEIPKPKSCDVYIIGLGKRAELESFKLARTLREASFTAQSDIVGRSLKAQMKYADKLSASFTLVIGDEELEKGASTIKNMASGEKYEISLGDDFLDSFIKIYTSENQNNIALKLK